MENALQQIVSPSNSKTVRQYRSEAFQCQTRLQICSCQWRIYLRDSLLRNLAAPAMLSFPKTAGDGQGRHLVYARVSTGEEKLRRPGRQRIALMKKGRSLPRMSHTKRLFVSLTALLVLAAPSYSQTKAKPVATGMTALEQRASLNLDAAWTNPLQLRNLLFKMPKGADLHNHLDGAVYAESWIRAAAEDHLCLDRSALQGTKSVFTKPGSQESPACSGGKIPTADIYKDQDLYDDVIDAFSMRGFVASASVTGHDQFFRTFARF